MYVYNANIVQYSLTYVYSVNIIWVAIMIAVSRPYHHGDLRQVLLTAALTQIEAEGVASFSLRALARLAGVSAAAPYRHFDSKRTLLAALAQQGFEGLGQRLVLARDAETGPNERLLAIGLAYIEFAVSNPTNYHLMFGSVIDDFSEYNGLRTAADDGFSIVLELLRELIEAGGGGGLGLNILGGATWSAVHGIASLQISDMRTGLYQHEPLVSGEPGPIVSVEALRADTLGALRVLLSGLLVKG